MKQYTENKIDVPRFNEANGFYTTKERSELMSKIKSQDTKPEIMLKKALWNIGFRYRKNLRNLPGTPDIVFIKYKLAVFVDGEFWHGYKWYEKKLKIKTNRDFWIPKIEMNIQRDYKNNKLLEEKGWHVIRFWEHEIRKDLDSCISKISNYLKINDDF